MSNQEWRMKAFKTSDELSAWIKDNEEQYWIVSRFVTVGGLLVGYRAEYCEKN